MHQAFIYLFDNLQSLGADFLEKNLNKLPLIRQEHCKKYQNDFDKKARVIAYLLLEKGLKEQYKITRPVSFIYSDLQKPYLKETPHIFFNVSHCKSGVACAIAEFELGIDIQDSFKFDIKFARKVCTGAEIKNLEESENPEKLFIRFWTEKESYAKAKGINVSDVFQKSLSGGFFYSQQNDNYCVTLCHMGLLETKNIYTIKENTM